MRIKKTINPVVRAIGVIGGVAALVTGVTFAALSSTATLSNNSLSTATAGLNVANGDTDATSGQANGFAFTNLAPGTTSDRKLFNLKNTGQVPLSVVVQIPSVPSSGLTQTNSDQISFCFAQIDAAPTATVPASDEKCYTLNQLVNSSTSTLPGGPLPANGDNILYQVTAKIDPNFSASGASIPNFDFVFTGTQQNSSTTTPTTGSGTATGTSGNTAAGSNGTTSTQNQ